MENIYFGSGFLMTKISYEEILSIQRKVNIVDVVRDYVQLTQKGKNYFGICPFHDDHNPSMSVSEEKQMYKCFVCGASGNVFNFVMEYEKVSYYEAVKIVARKIGINLNIDVNNAKPIVKSPLYDIYDISCMIYQNNLNTSFGKKAKEYLKNRKISDEIIKEFKIGLSTTNTELTNILNKKNFSEEDILNSGVCIKNGNHIHDLYKNRIMFPLFDLNGNVVAFSGRVYDEVSESKYINTMETSIFKKGNLLYNYHNAKFHSRKNKSVIVVEGFMDVIRLSTIGVKNVVATMGTAVTKNQASLINKMAPEVILMFDGDEAGNKATKSYLESFDNNMSNIKIVRLEDNLDPDEYILKNGEEKMLYHLSHPLNVINYKIEEFKNNIDFNNSEDVSKYVNLLLPELSKIEDDIVRNLEIKKLSDLTSVSEEVLNSKIKVDKKDIIVNKHVKREIKKDKYDKASKYILFNMIKNNEYILYYFNNLSILPNDLDRKLANEIVIFYKKYESFNINDFVVYLEDKKDLINLIIQLDNMDLEVCESTKDLDTYFKVVREYVANIEISKLQNELKTTSNELKRKEIAQKIVDIKIKESM